MKNSPGSLPTNFMPMNYFQSIIIDTLASLDLLNSLCTLSDSSAFIFRAFPFLSVSLPFHFCFLTPSSFSFETDGFHWTQEITAMIAN